VDDKGGGNGWRGRKASIRVKKPKGLFPLETGKRKRSKQIFYLWETASPLPSREGKNKK